MLSIPSRSLIITDSHWLQHGSNATVCGVATTSHDESSSPIAPTIFNITFKETPSRIEIINNSPTAFKSIKPATEVSGRYEPAKPSTGH